MPLSNKRKDTSPSRTVVSFTVGDTDVKVKLAKRPRDGIRKYFVSWDGTPRYRALGPFRNTKDAINAFLEKYRNKLVPILFSKDIEFWIRDQELSDGVITIDFVETYNFKGTDDSLPSDAILYFATASVTDKLIVRTATHPILTDAAFEVMQMLQMNYLKVRLI